MKLIMRIWAKLTGGVLVKLTDFDGEKTLAIAYRIGRGRMKAERYWPWKIQVVVLNRDGTVSPNAQEIAKGYTITYVQRWEYV